MTRLSARALLPAVPVLASNRTCIDRIDSVEPMLRPAQTVQARKLVGCRGSPSTARSVHKSAHSPATSQSLHSPSPQARPASAGDTLAPLAIRAEETAVHWTRLAAVAEAVLCDAVPSEALFVWPTALPSVEFLSLLGGSIDREGLYEVLLAAIITQLYHKPTTRLRNTGEQTPTNHCSPKTDKHPHSQTPSTW